eukprot:m.179876 g.179876  ORF g.179876 m.179876 type:complete len:126 (-) comp14650_c0_seq3:1228-1605(-)
MAVQGTGDWENPSRAMDRQYHTDAGQRRANITPAHSLGDLVRQMDVEDDECAGCAKLSQQVGLLQAELRALKNEVCQVKETAEVAHDAMAKTSELSSNFRTFFHVSTTPCCKRSVATSYTLPLAQ